MSEADRKMFVGPSAHHVELCLTDAALETLQHMPGAETSAITDHREILTTITVAKAAAGCLHEDHLTIHRRDIESAIS